MHSLQDKWSNFSSNESADVLSLLLQSFFFFITLCFLQQFCYDGVINRIVSFQHSILSVSLFDITDYNFLFACSQVSC